MKKVGIMTMHRIINYGSFMQAYGLKKIIEKLGYEVEFVDFNYEKSLVNNKYKTINRIKNNLNIISVYKRLKLKRRFRDVYNQSLNDYLNVSEVRNYPYHSIDELVIGSDEVFNCIQEYPIGYSRELFGLNYENIPVISYAACFGQTTLEGLKFYKIDAEVAELLKKFKSISVRDNNSYSIINNLLNIKPTLNVDPVLVSDFSDEIVDNVKYSDYILVYAYSNRLSKKEEKYVKAFAKKNNKKILCIGAFQRFADYNIIVKPFEIFAYFKHADFIITDTFHGSIFSIITHSKFGTIIRKGSHGNNNKLYDLLERMDRKDRIITDIHDIDSLYEKEIDYSKTDRIIEQEKEKTINYLKSNLV